MSTEVKPAARFHINPVIWVIIWFALVTTAITLPWWLKPTSYVWLLDSVWGPRPHIQWHSPDSTFGWQLYVTALTHLVTGPGAEKITLTGLLLAVGLSGYYLARLFLSPRWAWASGTLYLLNPFVYERLLGGQWIVLAGYALLPIALGFAWHVLISRGRTHAFRLAALLILYPLVSLHFAYINVFLTLALALVYILVERPAGIRNKRAVLWTGLVAAIGLIANWFWLTSPAGRSFQQFSALDFSTFRTAADSHFGIWANVLALYGFWHGSAFLEPKFFLGSAWVGIALIIVLLACLGAARAIYTRESPLIMLSLATPIALVLAVGYASPTVRPLTLFLMHYLPGFRGLRDSEKLVAIIALTYALLVPYGLSALTRRLANVRFMSVVMCTGLVALALVNVTGIMDDASNQIPITPYPPGYLTVANKLAKHPHAIVAILPWHDYLSLDFASNAYVANPAGALLANPTLSSHTFDNVLFSPPATPADRLMLSLTTGQVTPLTWAAKLRSLGASYVILEKTDDASSYAVKLKKANLKTIYSDNTIALYQL